MPLPTQPLATVYRPILKMDGTEAECFPRIDGELYESIVGLSCALSSHVLEWLPGGRRLRARFFDGGVRRSGMALVFSPFTALPL